MNDWYNDPPEQAEDPIEDAFWTWWDNEGSAMFPDHGEDFSEFAERIARIAWTNGAFKGAKFAQDEREYYEQIGESIPDVENTCRTCGKPTNCIYCSDECTPDCIHGNRPHNCDACDHLSDLAYDASR